MDIKDNLKEFKPKVKKELPKPKRVSGLTINFSTQIDYVDGSTEMIDGKHELSADQMFSLPQGPLFLLFHTFKYMHDQLFMRLRDELLTMYSHEELGLQSEEPQQANIVPGPKGIQ